LCPLLRAATPPRPTYTLSLHDALPISARSHPTGRCGDVDEVGELRLGPVVMEVPPAVVWRAEHGVGRCRRIDDRALPPPRPGGHPRPGSVLVLTEPQGLEPPMDVVRILEELDGDRPHIPDGRSRHRVGSDHAGRPYPGLRNGLLDLLLRGGRRHGVRGRP